MVKNIYLTNLVQSNLTSASAVLLLAYVNVSIAADEASWPQWRGSNFDLCSTETGWRFTWPAEGPTIRWKTNVGTGYSSVSVVKNRLLTMGHVDGKELIYCLDTHTGRPLWTHRYKGALVDNLHRGGPGSTPTIDGPFVYSLGRAGQLFCLRIDNGEVIWSINLQDLLDLELPEWGFTCSPLVRGQRLIVEAGRVVALDKQTGKLQWQTNAFPAGYGSPTPLTTGGIDSVAVLNNDGLLVVAEQDGQEIEFVPWETTFSTNSTSPLLVGDKIFLSTGYERGCALFEWQGDRLETVYENQEMSNHMNNSVVWEGHLFGFHGNAHVGRTVRLVCMEAETGKVKWSQLGLGCGSLMLADGKLIILSEDGELVIAAAQPDKYTELSRAAAVPERCWTVPVLFGGQIYCRNDVGDLSCIGLKSEE